MKSYFLVAGIVATIVGVGHAIIGEVLFFSGIKDSSYPSTIFGDSYITKQLIKVAWHFLTTALLFGALGLYIAALTDYFGNPTMIVRAIALEFLVFDILFFLYALTRPAILVRAPLWILLSLVVGFAWAGAA
jgi:hypothetical protein